MSISTKIAERITPGFLKKRELKKLFEVVASAYGSVVPSTAGLSYPQSLTLFAKFTAMETAKASERHADIESIRILLYQGAFDFGMNIRRQWRISDTSGVMDVGRMLYSFLGIEFNGTSEGLIDITRCLFADYYSPQTCRVISSLDEGVMAGLSAGGTLVFSRRITEGFHSCRANFTPKENPIEKSDRGGHRCWWCNCC